MPRIIIGDLQLRVLYCVVLVLLSIYSKVTLPFLLETMFFSLIIDLVENNIPPFRITPSIEEGLCMAFNKDDILAYLEFYNDGDVGLIAENTETQKTVINVGLRNEEIIPILLGLFNN